MYTVPLKTVLVEAVKKTFDREYLVDEFRDLHASLEFPLKEQEYPGIWVDFIPVGSLRVAGIGHREYAPSEDGRGARAFTRWRFQGEASFSIAALTSLERDRLLDEFIRVLAFGRESPSTSDFRTHLHENGLVAVDFDWDEISVRGNSSSLGTPWQSDDMIYEVEVAMECFGEFIADNQSQTLLPFDRIEVTAIAEGEEDPTDPEGWITA